MRSTNPNILDGARYFNEQIELAIRAAAMDAVEFTPPLKLLQSNNNANSFTIEDIPVASTQRLESSIQTATATFNKIIPMATNTISNSSHKGRHTYFR